MTTDNIRSRSKRRHQDIGSTILRALDHAGFWVTERGRDPVTGEPVTILRGTTAEERMARGLPLGILSDDQIIGYVQRYWRETDALK